MSQRLEGPATPDAVRTRSVAREGDAIRNPHAPSTHVEPAEARTFSIVEMLVLIVGFALAAGLMARVERWENVERHALVFGLLAHAAIGLGLCGPILVSWRERLGRRRPVWGLGESLWFATGLLVQVAVISFFAINALQRFGDRVEAPAMFIPVCLMILLPMLYLTGNPRIELRRAPASWSNVVGLTSVALWLLTAWAATGIE